MIHVLFVVVYFSLPGLVWWGSPHVPVWVLLPTAFVASVLVAVLHWRRLQAAAGGRDGLPYRDLEERLARLGSELNRSQEREETHHLQLLGLGELWRAVARSTSLQDVFDGILSYSQRRGGFEEIAVLLVEPGTQELVGTWALPMEQGSHLRRVRWAIRGLGGGVATVLRTARTLRMTSTAQQPVLRVNGERPQPRTNHTAYLAVPILSPLPRTECFEEGYLYHSGCPAFAAAPGTVDAMPSRRDGLELGPCIGCRHYPVHGVLLVTDLHRDMPLDDDDQRMIEALAATIAAVLDHAALFRGVQAEERFREQILDAMSNGLLTTDPRGRVVFANRRAREMLGEGETHGVPVEELLELMSASDPIRAALLEGRETLHLEGYLRPRDAERVPIRVNVAPYRMEPGGPLGAVFVFADLSRTKAMEDEIRHLDALAAVGRFASSLAHEIRNPLGGISAGVGYLARSVHMDEESQQNVGIIQSEIERLDGIIRNLLVVARPTEVQLHPCDAAGLAQQVVRSLEAWAEGRDVRVQCEVEASEPWPYLDRDMIHQVLLNLVKNAVEASPRRGTVTLGVRPDLSETETGVRFTVEDEGPGVPEADLPHLFEPFFSRKEEGTGLGLYVCHNFVQRHGGTLAATRREPHGARFTLWLPTYPALMGESHEPAHPDRR